MSLARAHVWNAGDLLTAADLNGEFNNILNNPISLISPTTGAINFSGLAHIGILPSGITTTSAASAGQAVIYNGVSSGGIWGSPTVSATGISVGSGSTGQVLAITSSGSPPAFRVIPPDGGLSTTVPSTGMLYYISTDAKVVGLAIGTSGQVLTVSTNSTPSWAAASGGSGGGSNVSVTSSAGITIFEEFYNILTTAQSGTNISNVSMPHYIGYTQSSGTPLMTLVSSNPTGVVSLNAIGTMVSNSPNGSAARYDADPTFVAIFGPGSTQANKARIGLVGTTAGNPLLLASTNALSNDCIFFLVSATGGSPNTVSAFARVGGVETIITTTMTLNASQGEFGRCQLVVSSSGTLCTVITNGVTAGAFTSSEMPTSTMRFQVGTGSSVAANQLMIDAWQLSMKRPTTFTI